jgi:hypothetical protein
MSGRLPQDSETGGGGNRTSLNLSQLRRHAGRVRAAEEAATASAPADGTVDLAEIASRLDRLEVFAEQTGLQAQLVADVNEYVKSLKAEVDALYWIRIGAIVFAALFCLALCGGAVTAFILQPRWLLNSRTHAVPAILIASVGASVALIALVLKGVFRAIGDRNKDELLPEHLKVAMETVKTVTETFGR